MISRGAAALLLAPVLAACGQLVPAPSASAAPSSTTASSATTSGSGAASAAPSVTPAGQVLTLGSLSSLREELRGRGFACSHDLTTTLTSCAAAGNDVVLRLWAASAGPGSDELTLLELFVRRDRSAAGEAALDATAELLDATIPGAGARILDALSADQLPTAPVALPGSELTASEADGLVTLSIAGR